MRLMVYLVGLAILVGAISWSLVAVGIAAMYVGLLSLIVAGAGVVIVAFLTRARDPRI